MIEVSGSKSAPKPFVLAGILMPILPSDEFALTSSSRNPPPSILQFDAVAFHRLMVSLKKVGTGVGVGVDVDVGVVFAEVPVVAGMGV
jgi:hypothetical protein